MSGDAALVLLDVEGTTTPVDFVLRVLFPDARERVRAFLESHSADPGVEHDLASLREERSRDAAQGKGPPAWDGSTAAAAAYARWLMDHDRKTTALKSLQGKIWADGYAAGRFRGQVYDDVLPALARWTAAGRRVAIFSSGSVLAQELLFRHSDHGDLTPFLSGYFDTTTGPKSEAESYRRIAAAVGALPGASLFVSDAVAEIDAARTAGFATALAVRVPPAPLGHGHPEVASFDALR